MRAILIAALLLGTAPAHAEQWWLLDNISWMQEGGPRCDHEPNTPSESPKAKYDDLKQQWQLPQINDKGDEVDVVWVYDGEINTTRFFRGEKACLIALVPLHNQWTAAQAKDRDTERYR